MCKVLGTEFYLGNYISIGPNIIQQNMIVILFTYNFIICIPMKIHFEKKNVNWYDILRTKFLNDFIK